MLIYDNFDLFECDSAMGNPSPAAAAPSDAAGQTSDSAIGGPDIFGCPSADGRSKKRKKK